MVTLKYGSTGQEVKHLQELLIKEGFLLTADGVFGANTASAVKQFQARKGLACDGVVGPKTWAALNAGDPAEIVAQLRTALEDVEKLPSVKKLMEMM